MALRTFADLKNALAKRIRDPSKITFSDADLGDLINAGILEVSRIAPQPFTEDIEVISGVTTYRVRGGVANLLTNGSFETGSDAILAGASNITPTVDDLAGWTASGQIPFIGYLKSAWAKDGSRVLKISSSETTAKYLWQTVFLTPGSTYLIGAWIWKAGNGTQPAYVRVDTVDGTGAVITSDVLVLLSSASSPVWQTGSVVLPTTAAGFRIRLQWSTTGLAQDFYWEDVRLLEANSATIVPDSSAADIEVSRVEVWSRDTEPASFYAAIPSAPAVASLTNTSQAGWEFRGGTLWVPRRFIDALTPGTHFLRVWGWAPYDQLFSDTQISDLTDELAEAVLLYGRLQAVDRLSADRDLFTQWQTRANASDVTPQTLLSTHAMLMQAWRERKRELLRIRY